MFLPCHFWRLTLLLLSLLSSLCLNGSGNADTGVYAYPREILLGNSEG